MFPSWCCTIATNFLRTAAGEFRLSSPAIRIGRPLNVAMEFFSSIQAVPGHADSVFRSAWPGSGLMDRVQSHGSSRSKFERQNGQVTEIPQRILDSNIKTAGRSAGNVWDLALERARKRARYSTDHAASI